MVPRHLQLRIERVNRHHTGIRRRLWLAMRMLREFTPGELEAVTEVKGGTVSAYISALYKTGYLQAGRSQFSKSQRYRLVRDSGPLCPSVIRYSTAVWDPNTNQEYSKS